MRHGTLLSAVLLIPCVCAAAPEYGKEYPLESVNVYVAMRCEGGRAVSARAPEGEKHYFVFFGSPFFPGGQTIILESSSAALEVDAPDSVYLAQPGANGRVALGRARLEGYCEGRPDGRELYQYAFVEPAPGFQGTASVTLDGGCRSRSNWPNGPGRSYWRDVRIRLTLGDGSGASYARVDEANIAFADADSCRTGGARP